MLLIPLSTLRKGITGTIASLSKDETSLKLMEMGIIPGEKVSIEAISAFGDPIAIKVDNNILTMRKSDASHILIQVNE